MNKEQDMTNKVCVITGGGRGMGAATARELQRRGYQLVLMSPSDSAVQLARELGGIGLQGRTDSEADLQRLVQTAVDAHGRIDAVLNHTGGPPKGDLLSLTDDEWRQGNELIMMSVVRTARLVTPHMLAQGKGAIVNITTFAALEPTLAFPISCSYRAAVAAYTKLYADRYAEAGIRMNSVLPGYIDSLDHKPETAQSIPMKRIGTVDEIAKTVAFLLSDDAGYITGQNLRVDGGLTRSV